MTNETQNQQKGDEKPKRSKTAGELFQEVMGNNQERLKQAIEDLSSAERRYNLECKRRDKLESMRIIFKGLMREGNLENIGIKHYYDGYLDPVREKLWAVNAKVGIPKDGPGPVHPSSGLHYLIYTIETRKMTESEYTYLLNASQEQIIQYVTERRRK